MSRLENTVIREPARQLSKLPRISPARDRCPYSHNLLRFSQAIFRALMDRALGPFTCLPLLPAEIQHQIFKDLQYPDLLSLKLANGYFYNTVETTVRDRADWLLDRAQRSLMIPRQSKCLLRSDAEFCSHPEVLQILRWRRKHLYCREPGGWCREVSGVQCKNRSITFADPYRWYIVYDITRGFCCHMAAVCAYLFNNLLPSTNVWLAVLGALFAIMVLRFETTPIS